MKRWLSILLLALAGLAGVAQAAEVWTWSTTAANNNSAPPDGFPEGMSRPSVNDSIRELMASLRRWYSDPEFLNLAYTHTVSKVDADTIRLNGATDLTSLFTTDRGILVCAAGINCVIGFVASSSYAAPNTDVNLFFHFGEIVPNGADSAKVAAAQNLGTAAWHNTGTITDRIPLAQDVPGLVSWPLRAFAKKTTGNQTFTGATTRLNIDGVTDYLTVPSANGVKDYLLTGLIPVSYSVGGDDWTLAVKLGATGTTADTTIYQVSVTQSTGFNNAFAFSGLRIDNPAANDRLSIAFTRSSGSGNCTVEGAGTTSTRFAYWSLEEIK